MNFTSDLCMAFVLLLTVIASLQDTSADAVSYGTDCTFPAQHEIDIMQKECKHFRLRYKDFIAGCSKAYGEESCAKMEKSRMDKNIEMPPLQHNYTYTGYRVDKVDNGLWRQISKFYEAHQNDSAEEAWPPGFYLANVWQTPTKLLNIYDPEYEEGSKLRDVIEKGLQPIVEEWVGHRVIATGIAGIRIYQEKAILATHVDRIPSVITAHIAVEATSDWPFEVYDHSGYAHNISAKTGEVILYESSTVLHGRPFPLEGPRYACLTVHYIPIDHDNLSERDLQTLPDVEPLMIRRRHGHTFRKSAKAEKDSNGPTMMDAIQVQAAASRGEIVELDNILEKFPKLIYFTDENGWQPLFEAVRGGNIEAVQYLVRRGANLDWKNYNDESVMDIALQHLSADHVVTNYLKLFFPNSKN